MVHPGPCPVQVREGTQGLSRVGWGPSAGFEDTLNGLDEELAGLLKNGQPEPQAPEQGPPKDELAEPEDLLVEVVED